MGRESTGIAGSSDRAGSTSVPALRYSALSKEVRRTTQTMRPRMPIQTPSSPLLFRRTRTR